MEKNIFLSNPSKNNSAIRIDLSSKNINSSVIVKMIQASKKINFISYNDNNKELLISYVKTDHCSHKVPTTIKHAPFSLCVEQISILNKLICRKSNKLQKDIINISGILIK